MKRLHPHTLRYAHLRHAYGIEMLQLDELVRHQARRAVSPLLREMASKASPIAVAALGARPDGRALLHQAARSIWPARDPIGFQLGHLAPGAVLRRYLSHVAGSSPPVAPSPPGLTGWALSQRHAVRAAVVREDGAVFGLRARGGVLDVELDLGGMRVMTRGPRAFVRLGMRLPETIAGAAAVRSAAVLFGHPLLGRRDFVILAVRQSLAARSAVVVIETGLEAVDLVAMAGPSGGARRRRPSRGRPGDAAAA